MSKFYSIKTSDGYYGLFLVPDDFLSYTLYLEGDKKLIKGMSFNPIKRDIPFGVKNGITGIVTSLYLTDVTKDWEYLIK